MDEREFDHNHRQREESIQEIITYIPNWTVRFGIGSIAIIFLLLLALTWMVKYPDIIQADITITTDPPPAIITTGIAGRIRLLLPNEHEIQLGEDIAYIMNATEYSQVAQLEVELNKVKLHSKEIINIRKFDGYHQLGGLQEDYERFLRSVNDYNLFVKLKAEEIQIKNATAQILQLERFNRSLVKQKDFAEKELVIQRDKYEIDSILFSQKVLTIVDLNNSELVLLQNKRTAESAETNLINNSISISILNSRIAELEMEKEKKEYELSVAVKASIENLMTSIDRWRTSYVMTANTQGRLAYLKTLAHNQYVRAETEVFAIVPLSDTILGRVNLPISGSGKVKIGQQVNIRLHNYPSGEFGILTGEVNAISSIPSNNFYTVYIRLPYGLRTSYNNQLEFRQEMTGTTDIITEDLRLLERMLYSFRDAVNRFK